MIIVIIMSILQMRKLSLKKWSNWPSRKHRDQGSNPGGLIKLEGSQPAPLTESLDQSPGQRRWIWSWEVLPWHWCQQIWVWIARVWPSVSDCTSLIFRFLSCEIEKIQHCCFRDSASQCALGPVSGIYGAPRKWNLLLCTLEIVAFQLDIGGTPGPSKLPVWLK